MENYQNRQLLLNPNARISAIVIMLICGNGNLAKSLSLSFETTKSRLNCSQVCDYDSEYARTDCERRGLYFVPLCAGCEDSIMLELQENHIQHLTRETLSGYRHLKTLDVSRNEISVIDEGAFIRLTHLRNVMMYHNQLRFLLNRTFLGTEDHLTRIHLNYNELLEINENAFSGLENVIALYLSYNQIEELPSSVFCDLHELQNLFLRENNLYQLNKFLFCGLKKLKLINLNSNNLAWIPEGLFSNLDSLREVILSNNNLVNIPSLETIGHVNYKVFDVADNMLNQSRNISSYLKSAHRIYMEGNPFKCDCDFLLVQQWYMRLPLTVRQNYESRQPVMCGEYNISDVIPVPHRSVGEVGCLPSTKSSTDDLGPNVATSSPIGHRKPDEMSITPPTELKVKPNLEIDSYPSAEKVLFIMSVYNAAIVTMFFVMYLYREFVLNERNSTNGTVSSKGNGD